VRASRWNLVAFGLAAVAALAAGVFLVWSVHDRADARAEVHRTRAELVRAESAHASDAHALEVARPVVHAVSPQLVDLGKTSNVVGALDARAAAAVKAAVYAGLAGDIGGYNAAVGTLSSANPLADKASEQLRAEINTIVVALDPIRG